MEAAWQIARLATMYDDTMQGMGDSRNLERSLENMVLLSLIQDGTMSCTGANGGNDGDSVIPKSTSQFALLEFERPIACPTHSLVIGSRLDADAYIQSQTMVVSCDQCLNALTLVILLCCALKVSMPCIAKVRG